MNLTRKESIALLGGALLLSSCGRRASNAIRVGSKNFGENITVAEVYAGALERAGMSVERHMNLGSTQIAMAALQRGDIDLYPEYTGTGLIDVLHLPPMHDAAALYRRVASEYQKRYGLRWLVPSPANDSQGLCTTQAIAAKYNVRTLSQCALAAPHLRFAAIPEFVTRADALPGLQKYYGGFKFASVKTFTIGLQYDALTRGDADVATAFTTDSQIATEKLVLLQDDRKFWPAYNIAPVAREPVLAARPEIAKTLDAIAPLLTDDVLREFNRRFNVDKADAADIAQQFLSEHTH